MSSPERKERDHRVVLAVAVGAVLQRACMSIAESVAVQRPNDAMRCDALARRDRTQGT
jgi:hypothetical protein